MSDRDADTAVKYVAVVAPVREVSLVGAADLAFWKERLGKERLSPTEIDNRAQVLITAMESKFMGVRFREVCVSVFVCRQEGGGGRDGIFLAQAFNSSRAFSFIERACFSTPYEHATIQVDARLPASVGLTQADDPLFKAAMGDDPAPASRGPAHVDDDWEGPIFLPRNGRKKDADGQFFFAKLNGPGRTFRFSGGDVARIFPSPRRQGLRDLSESEFTPKEWVVKESATHARSKTFARNRGLGF